MRRALTWLAAAAVAAACGSKDDDAGDRSEPQPAVTDDGDSSDTAERDEQVAACREAGDASACVRVATRLAASPEREDEAAQYRGLACLFGDGASCAVVAEGNEFPATWHDRACRRGYEPSCAKGTPKARFPAPISVVVAPPGAAAEHIARAFRGAVEDCLVVAPERASEPAELAYELAVDGNRISAVTAPEGDDPRVEACLDKSSAQWRFPALAEPATLTLTVAWPAS